MAKRNLTSVMSGIMGNDAKPVEEVVEVTTMEKVKTEPKAEPKPRKGPGRPRKGEVREPDDSIRATFVGDRQIIRSLKYIAIMEDCMLKEIIDDAFKSYIEKWEKKNGPIPVKVK